MWQLDSSKQAALWWIALAAMVVDHLAVAFAPGITELRIPGRIVLPIFAALIAYNVTMRGVPPEKYLRRLVPIAALAQIPYMIAFGNGHINILGTLALGVLALTGWRGLAVATVAVVALNVGGMPVEYGHIGVWLPWLFSMWLLLTGAARVVMLAAIAWGVFWLNPGSIMLGVSGLAALALLALSHLLPSVPRAPRLFGYAFYPAHLAVIALGVVLL